MNLWSLILPLGIATYTMLLLTILIGKRIIKIKFKYHKIAAITTLILATMHGSLAVYLNYFS